MTTHFTFSLTSHTYYKTKFTTCVHAILKVEKQQRPTL